jgi:hypothetical protein
MEVGFLVSRNCSREAVRLRHGGAFVVVPDPQRAPIELKHPTGPLPLGGELAELWLSLARAHDLLGSNLAAAALEQTRVRRQVRSAAVAGGWVILIAIGFLTLLWLIYLTVMSTHPAWLLTMWGPGVDWPFVQNVWFWVMAAFKFCVWLMFWPSSG